MARLDSPMTRWPGYIELPDYLTYPVLVKWDEAVVQADSVKDNMIKFYQALLPVACSVVLEWHIEGLPDKVTAETVPASAKFVAWVVDGVMDLFEATSEPISPKAPALPLTPENSAVA